MSLIKAVERKVQHILRPKTFLFPQSRAFVGRYAKARQATDDNTAHAHCMLDT
jgi:hypothetical protein